MTLSKKQYQDIMDAYDQIRRENQMEQQRRRDEVHHTVPEIRAIDEKIAHISVESAKHMVFHPEDDCREALRNEIYDLSMERVNLLAIHQYPADYLDSIYQCPLCRDTGYIGTEKCQCFKQRIAALLSRESNLQELSREANFSLFRLDYYSEERDPGNMQQPSPRENMQHILRKCTDYIQRFSLDPGKNLLIFGNTGVGKTFLASCIATELLGQGNSVIYLTAHQFFDRLADYTFRREKENSDTLSTLLQCDLLIIDDLGTELNNGFINSQLFLCINERILHKKSTIISTNLSLKQLNRIYTERISSRIIENYEHLHIFGEDIRIKKAFSSLD